MTDHYPCGCAFVCRSDGWKRCDESKGPYHATYCAIPMHYLLGVYGGVTPYPIGVHGSTERMNGIHCVWPISIDDFQRYLRSDAVRRCNSADRFSLTIPASVWEARCQMTDTKPR